MALPKNTGVTWPARNVSASKGLPAVSSSSTSSAGPRASVVGPAPRPARDRPSRISAIGTWRSPPPSSRSKRSSLRRPAIVDADEAGALRPAASWPGCRGRPAPVSISSIRSNGVLAHAIHLVDEGDDRDAAHPADLEQLDGLRLDPLDAVDQHDGGVGGGQRAVGVLGEVVVAGGVEQVHAPAGVFELQHAAGDRDAALAFDVHPVAGDGAAAALALDRAGQVQAPRRRAGASRSAWSCPRRGAR